jgi:hypothetical protein
LFAIQFTGEDENIAKIEKEASPVFKHFKIDKHKDRFYLIVETIKSNYPGRVLKLGIPSGHSLLQTTSL